MSQVIQRAALISDKISRTFWSCDPTIAYAVVETCLLVLAGFLAFKGL